jgi:ribosomal protein S18 acetylase RimI-like enzyme
VKYPVTYQTFDLDILPKLVTFWNRVFKAKRNFYPVDEKLFLQRIINQEAFDPYGLTVAMGENRCAKNGTIAVLAVRPHYRNSGIGAELLRQSEDYLGRHRGRDPYIYIGDYWVPLYHVLEGPRQPFWGDTEMIGIDKRDRVFIGFLEKRGYEPVLDEGQEIAMAARLGNRDMPQRPERVPLGLREVEVSEQNAWNGRIAWYPEPEKNGYIYPRFGPYVHSVIAFAREDTVVAHLERYPMKGDKTVALLDFLVAEEYRGYGLGSYLLDKALWTMAQLEYDTVELHTNTKKNAMAFDMYTKRSFKVVKRWAGLRKKLNVQF